jgi:calcineurin-like phosphoesterase family protein
MANIFVISDTHFGHVGVTKFMSKDGVTKLRPWDTVEEMDEAMISRWNSVVSHSDTVYHLGDVVINRKALHTLYRLNGRKILIKGNHDIFKLADYTPFFEDVRAYHVLNGMIFSHIPVHPDSLGRFGTNIHGHTHDRSVMVEINGSTVPDMRYLCVCVEQTGFTPISLDTVQQRVIAQGGTVGFRV